MAAEGPAPSGSGVAGMVCSLWVLVLVSSVLALEGKRVRRPENPHLLAETQPTWEVGKRKRQEGVETSKGGKEAGRVQRKALDRQLCSCSSTN